MRNLHDAWRLPQFRSTNWKLNSGFDEKINTIFLYMRLSINVTLNLAKLSESISLMSARPGQGLHRSPHLIPQANSPMYYIHMADDIRISRYLKGKQVTFLLHLFSSSSFLLVLILLGLTSRVKTFRNYRQNDPVSSIQSGTSRGRCRIR